MRPDKKDRSDKKRAVPRVSGLEPKRETVSSAPPPQIEGYEIISELGEAGQGRVWRAVQLSTRREVALKVPRVDLLSSQKALARLEREVELAARLKHPHIAQIYDSGIYRGLYYYAMELIEGMPLDKYVEEHDLTERQILELMRTVCDAVQHAHQNRVIHRDIKPSNIIVTADGRPHIVDFGLAVTIVEGDALKTISIEGEVTGTPAYMSPEQAAGRHDELDTRSDVYSLGVVIYTLLTGSFPYDVDTSMLQTLRNIQETEPTRPSRIVQWLDSDVEAIVLKALAKEPAHRYQSAAELRHDIDRWLDGLPVVVRSDSASYLLRKIIARYRYSSSVVALVIIIVFGFSWFSLELFTEIRRINVRLLTLTESLDKENEQDIALTQQAGMTRFLKAWHEGDLEQASHIAGSFASGEREAVAARFFLDERLLTEKVTEFREQLPQSTPHFVDFVIAEHYLKAGNEQAALNAYQRCLSCTASLEQDQWLATWVKSRLYELNAESPPILPRPSRDRHDGASSAAKADDRP